MLMGMSEELLHKAIEALKNGDRRRSARLLGQVVATDPDNLAAWWYLAAVLEDAEQRIQCLQQVLRLRPDHAEARRLIALLERQRVQVTPAFGVQRPVLEADPNTLGDLMVVREEAPPMAPARRHPNPRDVIVAGSVVLIALLAVAFTAVLIWTGVAATVLDVRGQQPEPTLRVLSIGVPACAATGERSATLVFVNNTGVVIDVFRGETGAEMFLFTLGPDAQGSVEAEPSAATRYAFTTKATGMTGSGALIEVPRGNRCHVPVQ